MIFIKKIKAFILDLDGVITDTSCLHEKAWRKMAQEEGIVFDENLLDKLRGVSRRKSLELILKNSDKTYTEEEFLELMEKKNNYYKESLHDLSPENMLPCIEELLDLLKVRGINIAMASSSKNAMLVIEKLQIKHKFDAIVDGTEIINAKPDPEIFLKAANKLNLLPNQCVVIEDAASGVEAAKSGGFFSIGIGPENRFNKEEQKPDLRFNNIIDLVAFINQSKQG